MTMGTFVYTLIVFFVAVYGCSKEKVLSLEEIPRYPGATEVDSMEHSGMGGIMSGTLLQLATHDPYDEVVVFYHDALKGYNKEVVSHESILGRQTAIALPQENGGISVAIQEFSSEGKVHITLMQVKR